MMEVAVVIAKNGEPIHWHLPAGRTAVRIPDTRSLWDVLWSNRDIVQGVAHSHPGAGLPGPSYEDVTTFAPIEGSLGQRLDWWITSQDSLVIARWVGPDRLSYASLVQTVQPPWVDELRRLSYAISQAPKM